MGTFPLPPVPAIDLRAPPGSGIKLTRRGTAIEIALDLAGAGGGSSGGGTKVTLDSPDLVGTPTAPTAAAGSSTQQVANTAFVANAVQSAAGSIAAGALAAKLDKASPAATDSLTVTSAGDALVQLEASSASASAYRTKRIMNSPNVGGGSDWLFRSIRPSDGAIRDFFLRSGDNGQGDILHQGNLKKINFRDKKFTLTDYAPNPANIAAAVNAAVADLAANNARGTIVIPAGTWTTVGEMDLSNLKARVVGDGLGVSEIIQAASGTNTIKAVHVDGKACTHIEGLSILANGVINAGSAIRIEHPANIDWLAAPTLSHLQIQGVDVGNADQRWVDQVVYLKNCAGMKADHLTIRGGGGNYLGTNHAVWLDGSTTDCAFDHVRIYFAQNGYYVSGNAEGINWSKCYTLLTNYGIYAADGGGMPGGFVRDCHFNTRVRGVYLVNRQHWKIGGNEFYKFTTTADWYGVEVTQGGKHSMTDNVVIGFRGASGWGGYAGGMAIGSSIGNRVTGNNFIQLDVGADFLNTGRGKYRDNIISDVVTDAQSMNAGVDYAASYNAG